MTTQRQSVLDSRLRVETVLLEILAELRGLRAGSEKALELIATQSKCRDDVTPQPADPQQLLTAAEVAGLLRIDQRTLRSLRHERAFPRPTRVGRSLRWKRGAVERWIDGGAR